MPPTSAERRATWIILGLAVLLAVGMLALGIGSWLTRDRQAGFDRTAAPATRVAPTQPVVAVATGTPAPATTPAPPTIALTATPRPAATVATPAPPTSVPAMATRAASGGETATAKPAEPGPVTELDPTREAQRTVVAMVGDGKLGDHVAVLLNQFYPVVTRAYAENNPELLRPFLAEDAYEGYVRGIKRAYSEAEVSVPVQAYRIQPKILSNGREGYAVNVAVVAYDRDIDSKTRQVLRVSKPYRQCERWYLVEFGSELKIEGGIVIAERHCDAGWPEPPVPTKG